MYINLKETNEDIYFDIKTDSCQTNSHNLSNQTQQSFTLDPIFSFFQMSLIKLCCTNTIP